MTVVVYRFQSTLSNEFYYDEYRRSTLEPYGTLSLTEKKVKPNDIAFCNLFLFCAYSLSFNTFFSVLESKESN